MSPFSRMKNTAIRGRYKPEYKDKYVGNANKVTYRSLWERRFMLYCDRSPNILTWSSEELHIPYVSPTDDKWHNYYPDFQISYLDKNGDLREALIEIKPHYQRKWNVNKAKWAAAEEYCKQNNLEFKVLTEKELF